MCVSKWLDLPFKLPSKIKWENWIVNADSKKLGCLDLF